MVPRCGLNLNTDKIKENYKSSLNPIYFIRFCVKTQGDKMKKLKISNLSEKNIQNLKKIKIIELEEMEIRDLKILKIKIETAIKTKESD